MGCDIHLVMEVKDGDRWIARQIYEGFHRNYVKAGENDWASPACRSRNYTRFAALAGVRGDGPEPKGIPSDASETTMYLIKQWGRDGHSHSFLPIDEAVSIFAATQFPELSGYAQKYPASYFFNHEERDGEARIVFWFDN